MGPILWAMDNFGDADFGDTRRVDRLLHVAATVAERPAGTVTAVFSDPAEREGAYRLLSNEEVKADEVARASHVATARKCIDKDYVYIAEDGTSINLTDTGHKRGTGPIGARSIGARGFQLMNALAIDPDGVPVGLLGQEWWARDEEAVPKKGDKRAREDKESAHWWTLMSSAKQLLSGAAPNCRPWFQFDRGGDYWPVLKQASADGIWLTVRASSDRRLADVTAPKGKGHARKLWATLADQPEAARYDLSVPGAPGRRARSATFSLRYTPVMIEAKDKRSKTFHRIKLWAVHAKEVGTTPEEERPLEWMLLTTRPVNDVHDAAHTVLGYCLRWRVEEFHRAWKSAVANVEDTQLRSVEAIRKWGTILAAVAIRVLRLTYLARNQPDEPATGVLTPTEIEAVRLLHPRRPKQLRGTPTIATVVKAIAEIGGYTGKSSGGPPGVQVIARGWVRVEAGAALLAAQRFGLTKDSDEGEM